MRTLILLFIVGAVSVPGASAESFGDRTLLLWPNASDRYVPVSVIWPGDDPEDAAVATLGKTRLPLTVNDGRAYIVVPPNSGAREQTLSIEPKKSKRRRAVTVAPRADEPIVDVTIDGDLFTSYYHDNEQRKPYLWPLNAEGGVSVTRDWPMGERNATRDHPHHTSFWTAHGDVNGADYWEYGERTGWQKTQTIETGSGDAMGWIRTRILWEDKDHLPVILEDRTYRFYATPAKARLFDVTIKLTARYGDVKFGDTKEGGMIGLRMNDDLRERGGSGTITNSAGGVGAAQTWGKPANWCDYSGVLERLGARGVAVMDHPSSFRHPTHWHVRDYGLMGANAFGYSYFYHGEKNGDYTLPAGDTMTFSYRIFVHSGDVDAADVAGYYGDFAHPPEARIE